MTTTTDRPARVPTYKRRRRMTSGQAAALARLWPRFGVAVDGTPLDLRSLFGRSAPVVLEIGFGMGEATAEMAAAEPDRDVLAVDVHTPGVGSLLRLVEARGLRNVRVAEGDARTVLTRMLGPASLDEVRVFFPDPWPKTRHAKRRLVTPEFAALVAERLAPGGRLHLATDSTAYADQIRHVLAGRPEFHIGESVPWRARTRFERQGLAAGRSVHEVLAVRR